MIAAGDSRAPSMSRNKSWSNLPRTAAASEFNTSNNFGSDQAAHSPRSAASHLSRTRGYDYDRYGVMASPTISERGPMPVHIRRRQQSFSPEHRRRVRSRVETLPSFSSSTSTVVG